MVDQRLFLLLENLYRRWDSFFFLDSLCVDTLLSGTSVRIRIQMSVWTRTFNLFWVIFDILGCISYRWRIIVSCSLVLPIEHIVSPWILELNQVVLQMQVFKSIALHDLVSLLTRVVWRPNRFNAFNIWRCIITSGCVPRNLSHIKRLLLSAKFIDEHVWLLNLIWVGRNLFNRFSFHLAIQRTWLVRSNLCQTRESQFGHFIFLCILNNWCVLRLRNCLDVAWSYHLNARIILLMNFSDRC